MTRVRTTPQDIPLIGLGTWPLKGDECLRAVATGLEVGIRHIDTAQLYGNEREVGQAVAKSGLKREDVFIVTKVMLDNLDPVRFIPSVHRSIEALGTSYVDLLLIHWPPRQNFEGALASLNEALDTRLARRIGISNFNIAQIEKAQALSAGRLVNLQVEFHTLLDQSRVKATAEKLGMCLSAYSPLARGEVMKHPIIAAIAARLGRPASEVALRWIVQQGVVAIPMTTKRENAASNLRALDFELADLDMAAITALNRQNRRLISPAGWAPQWDA